MFKTTKDFVLASGSPRRKEMLARLGIQFSVVVPEIDETQLEGEAVDDYVLRMARTKGGEICQRFSSSWVLAADTIVIDAGQLLPKPESKERAVEMLMRLSGREHQVRTGYCLCCLNEQVSIVRSVLSRVRFKVFDAAWARSYAETAEPMDKAGAYGIQDRGGVLVETVSGSYSNVVGLPLAEVVDHLCRHRVVVPAAQPQEPI